MPIDQATLKQLAINNPVNDSGAYYHYPEFTSSPPKDKKQDEVNIGRLTPHTTTVPLLFGTDLLYTSASLVSFEFAYSGDYT